MSGAKPIIAEIMMGHEIGVSGSYMKPTDREMLEEYSKAIDNLTILERGGTKVDLRNAFREQLLLVAGFSQDEVSRMDLSKTTDEEPQLTIRQKLLGMMAGNGSRQIVIPVAQVESKLAEGWEFVSSLPEDRAIVKLPS